MTSATRYAILSKTRNTVFGLRYILSKTHFSDRLKSIDRDQYRSVLIILCELKEIVHDVTDREIYIDKNDEVLDQEILDALTYLCEIIKALFFEQKSFEEELVLINQLNESEYYLDRALKRF